MQSHIDSSKIPILVLYGDTPLIQEETLQLMQKALTHHHIVVLGMHVPVPNTYGRIFADETGLLTVLWRQKMQREKNKTILYVIPGLSDSSRCMLTFVEKSDK